MLLIGLLRNTLLKVEEPRSVVLEEFGAALKLLHMDNIRRFEKRGT